MIDIHCHILPDVDDGPETQEESLKMARAAVIEGISTIIATPHHKNGEYENTRDEIIRKTRELNELLKKEQLPLHVLPGQETRINGGFIEDYEQGKLLPLNKETKYIFVELPFRNVPRYTEQLLFEIQLKGLVPIIVHPERNLAILERPEMLYHYVVKGALTQITAASIAGYFGSKIKKFTGQLIENNLVHFVASDAHNTTSRSFKMKEAYDVIEKNFGSAMVSILKENAELLVENKNICKEPPERIKKKRFFGIF